MGNRNAMALINMGWAPPILGWAGPFSRRTNPRTHPHPDEMNLPWGEAVARLQADQEGKNHPQLFFDAFGTTDISADLVSKAIAQFVRTMVSADSKFDRYKRGKSNSLKASSGVTAGSSAKGVTPRWFRWSIRGGLLPLPCRGGVAIHRPLFRNNGLDASFEQTQDGFWSGDPLDSGRFRTTTLRNVALSAPYMHDGRFNTLEEVIEHYNSGGVPSSTIDPFMKYGWGDWLAPVLWEDLIAFLHTLTDTSFVTNPAFRTRIDATLRSICTYV